MKKIRAVLAGLAAIAGIGGAYAFSDVYQDPVGTIYNWHTAGGTEVLRATIPSVNVICSGNSGVTCMIGTAPQRIPIVLFELIR